MSANCSRGVGRKIFWGFPKGCKQNSRESGGRNPPDAEGLIASLCG